MVELNGVVIYVGIDESDNGTSNWSGVDVMSWSSSPQANQEYSIDFTPTKDYVRLYISTWTSTANIAAPTEVYFDNFKLTDGTTEDVIDGGIGNKVAFKYRIHDASIGRFLSRDPLSKDYPWNSPYAFSENRLVDAIELEGAECQISNTGEIYQGPVDIQLINANNVKERPEAVIKYITLTTSTTEDTPNLQFKLSAALIKTDEGSAGFRVGISRFQLGLINTEKEFDIFGIRDNIGVIGGKKITGYNSKKHKVETAGERETRKEFSVQMGQFGFKAEQKNKEETQKSISVFGVETNIDNGKDDISVGTKFVIPLFGIGIDVNATLEEE